MLSKRVPLTSLQHTVQEHGQKNAFSEVLDSDGCSPNDLYTRSASKKMLIYFFFNCTTTYSDALLLVQA